MLLLKVIINLGQPILKYPFIYVLYGSYQTLWTNIGNFQKLHSEYRYVKKCQTFLWKCQISPGSTRNMLGHVVTYVAKYQIWCETNNSGDKVVGVGPCGRI